MDSAESVAKLGEQLERLRLTGVKSTGRVIGKGAYGRVIEVYVHRTLCAAKEIHQILLEHVTPREFEVTKHCFISECVKASRMLHPNVVQMLGIHYPTRQAKLPWLVMEYMDSSLKSFLEKYSCEKVPFYIKLSILVDTAQGLEFLHGQDIIHRDLSSNNILLTKHLVAKIADLGVAKVIEDNKMKTQTQTPGTLHFMPPEALLNKPRYGKPVDVFSLACVALHVITHQWPEPKERVQEDPTTYVMKALTEVERRDEYLRCCSILPLRALVQKCLHNQPDQRPNVSNICSAFKNLKATEDQKSPNSAANCIELLDTVQQERSQNQAMYVHFASLRKQLDMLSQEKSDLQQQLQVKSRQLEMFNFKAENQKKKAMDQFMQGHEQCQYHIQTMLSAQQNLLSAQQLMSKAMDQFGSDGELAILGCLNAHERNNLLEKMIRSDKYAEHYLQRLLMAEYKLPMSNNCALLIQLVRECNLTLGACLDVAKMDVNIDEAKRLLTQECPVCTVTYTRNEMINMINCDHAVCQKCFVFHFSKEKSIRHCNCPVCRKPNMSSETIDLVLYLQMFSALLQNYMNKEQYDMFRQRVNEWTLMNVPNFRWCVTCSTGFINDVGRQRVKCVNPDCQQLMCFHCKKPWEAQHEGLTCDGFARWKISNDPELQAQGLAAYLNEEGIECPKCNFKYALAKGGCLHFKCTWCPSEFCSGCNGFFKKDCTKYESCRKKGLHAHHPRDCLFYLRDEDVDVLQKLLIDNNIPFDVEPPEGQVQAEAKKGIQALEQVVKDDEDLAPPPMAVPVAAAPVLKCRVMSWSGSFDEPRVDEECGDYVESGHAGLCQRHYKVYLVFKINQNRIDPLPILEVNQLKAILRRDEIKIPDRLNGEDYKRRLQEKVVQDLPLKDRKVTKF